jgi:hypothetical protein
LTVEQLCPTTPDEMCLDRVLSERGRELQGAAQTFRLNLLNMAYKFHSSV